MATPLALDIQKLSEQMPLVGVQGSDVTITLAAGGSNVVGKLVVSYVTLPG